LLQKYGSEAVFAIAGRLSKYQALPNSSHFEKWLQDYGPEVLFQTAEKMKAYALNDVERALTSCNKKDLHDSDCATHDAQAYEPGPCNCTIATNKHRTLEELRVTAAPLMKLICEKCHPHHTVIVTPTSVELLESSMCYPKIYDFLVD
jgi:hypothetical protein